MKQRNGSKFTVKKVKEAKDYSFRENIAFLVIQVISKSLPYSFCFDLHLFQCVRNGTCPDVSLPLGEGMPSVRPAVPKPVKLEAVMKHQSRMK